MLLLFQMYTPLVGHVYAVQHPPPPPPPPPPGPSPSRHLRPRKHGPPPGLWIVGCQDQMALQHQYWQSAGDISESEHYLSGCQIDASGCLDAQIAMLSQSHTSV